MQGPISRHLSRLSILIVLVAGAAFHEAAAADVYSVELDPAERLSGATVLGEWATDGVLESWQSADVTGLAASGGSLTGTAAAGARVYRTSIGGSVDLDLGWNDYLQIRMQLPAGFSDDVHFRFGTSTHGGFASSRIFTLPGAELATDGAFHTYRLDLGLIVWWRDTLTDLEVQPLGASGTGIFAIDYVEVGDIPGDVLGVNTNLNILSGETFAELDKMESKHGVCWWSPETLSQDPDFATGPRPRRMLRMMEECWQVYTKILEYQDPCYANANTGTTRMKTNGTTWYGGFWMSGGNGDGRPYFNVGPGGLSDEGWGNPVPHEYAHCVQGAQPGYLTGGHWESHANFLRMARNSHYQAVIGTQVDVANSFLELSNTRQDHKRLIYADYRIHQAVTDFAEAFGLPSDQCAQMWIQGSRGETCYVKLDAALPAGASIEDFTGFSLRHWPFLDFETGEASYKGTLWTNAEEKALYFYRTGSHLIPLADKPGWFRSPFERSPEKYAFMYHELEPAGGTVEVELRGVDVIGTSEGWRWSLAARDGSDNIRYSPVMQQGDTLTFDMQPGETNLYLVVVATPSDYSLDLESFHNSKPTDKHIDRLHYPYEVRVVNATPIGRILDWSGTSGAAHPNGGGWVSSLATVDATAYVGPNAKVLDSAWVTGSARVEDYAVVADTARVENNAVVSGYALVMNNARVRGDAKVRDRGFVQDNSIIEGNAIVEDFAHPLGNTHAWDNATIRGVSWPFGSCNLSGSAIADYNYSMDFDQNTGTMFAHVPWGGWFDEYYIQTQRTPNGLIASYRIEAPEGEVCWDEFGAQHALLRGAPARPTDAEMRSAVLRLNGTDQYMVLDRSLADFATASYGMWVKPAASDAGETLLYFSGAPGKSLKWIARDASGLTRCTITDGSTTVEVASTTAVPVAAWTYLTVTFDGTTARLYVDGVEEDSAPCTLAPDDVLGANDYLSPEALYVGRDDAGAYFGGDLEDVRFYNLAMTADEIADEMQRAGACYGVFHRGTAGVFDGSTTKEETGSKHGLERTLEAWIKPDTSDDVSFYEAVFDSNDERDGGREGSGFGVDNGVIVVRLENVGFWNTGVPVTLGVWQKVVVTFNGTTAKIAVDDQIRGTRTYTATQNDVAGKNYRLGFAQDNSSAFYFFDGEIRDAKVYDRFFTDDDLISQNPIPAVFTPASGVVDFGDLAPTELPAADITVEVGNMGQGTLAITGYEQPSGTAFSYVTTPPNASLNTFETVSFQMAFDPPDFGLFEETLVIHTDVGDLSVPLRGRQIGSILRVDYPLSDTMDVGDAAVGAAGEPMTFTFSNVGYQTMTINSISTTGEFALDGVDLSDLPAGESRSFDVMVQPLSAGVKTGTATIDTDGGSATIVLYGNPNRIYWSHDGSDANNGLSAAAPVLTLGRVSQIAGTTPHVVVVEPGLYPKSLHDYWWGDAGSHLRFEVSGTGWATMDGHPNHLRAGSTRANTTVMTLEGIQFTSSDTGGYAGVLHAWQPNGRHDVSFKNCDFSFATSAVGNAFSINNGTGAAHVYAESTTFNGNGGGGLNFEPAEGILKIVDSAFDDVSRGVGVYNCESPQVEITGTTFTNFTGRAIDGGGSAQRGDWIVEGCEIVQGAGHTADRLALISCGGFGKGSVEFRRNYVYGTKLQGVTIRDCGGVQVVNNVFEQGGGTGAAFDGFQLDPALSAFYNNTVIRLGAQGGTGVQTQGGVAVNNVVLNFNTPVGTTNASNRNNLVDASGADPHFAFQAGAGWSPPSSPQGAAGYVIDEASSLFDAGDSLAAVLVDYAGETRPKNAAHDIGAFEAAQITVPAPPVVAPFAQSFFATLNEAFAAPAPTMTEPGSPAPVWSLDPASIAAGLEIDALSGVVTWSTPAPVGTHVATLTATNSAGSDSVALTIEVTGSPARAGGWMLYE